MNFEVTKEDSFECCIRLLKSGHNPVVLDFASGTNPGGGWRGKQTGTQEESLCKRSNLGILLEKKKYPIPRDSLYYIKNVIIDKDINFNKIDNCVCSVIASELKGISSSSEQYLIKRIDELYLCALNNKHDSIVLGLWGCGAFGESSDDIEILAKIMKVVRKKYQECIFTTYAIYKSKKYDLFCKFVE